MLLVDAYNVLHVTGVLPPELAGPDVAALARLVAHSRYRHLPSFVVCDGVGRGVVGSVGRTEIVFAGGGVEADTWIEQTLEVHRGARTTVVSDDRRIRRAARRARARWIASPAFLEQLALDAESWRGIEPVAGHETIPLRRDSVDRWMSLFGLDDSEALAELLSSVDLSVPAPVEPAEHESAAPSPDYPSQDSAAPDTGGPKRPRARQAREDRPPPPRDPQLERLLRESGAAIDPKELDMERWLGEEPRAGGTD